MRQPGYLSGSRITALAFRRASPLAAGLRAMPVLDDAFALTPAAEQAIVDPDDREPVEGEIYAVRIASPFAPDGFKIDLVQLRGREYMFGVRVGDRWEPGPPAIGWMMHFALIRPRPEPRGFPTMTDALASPLAAYLCDGPLQSEPMRERTIGRVVGVIQEAI